MITGSVDRRSQSLPYNGFYPFYFDNNLYVKVYPGPDVPEALAGKPYVLEYYSVDGAEGNIPEDSMSGYVSSITESDTSIVDITMSNEAFTGGIDLPDSYELYDLLSYWYYTKGSVTKVSDYIRWFRIQPEVGDAIAYSDKDIFLSSGKLELTGKIRVALLDKYGVPINRKSVFDTLDARVNSVADGAVLQYNEAEASQIIMQVRYDSVSNDDEFRSNVRNLVSNYFDMRMLRNVGYSLFGDMSVGFVFNGIMSMSDVKGLEVKPLMYKQFDIEFSSEAIERNEFKGLFYGDGAIDKGSLVLRFSDSVGIFVGEFHESYSYNDSASIVAADDTVVGQYNHTTGYISMDLQSIRDSLGDRMRTMM
jgi:hypothetical protein